MRTLSTGFAKGLIVGAAVAAAGLVGYAYGNGAMPRDGEARELDAAQCQVRLGPGHFQGGFQCASGEVMVGAQAGALYCADLTVSCPSH